LIKRDTFDKRGILLIKERERERARERERDFPPYVRRDMRADMGFSLQRCFFFFLRVCDVDLLAGLTGWSSPTRDWVTDTP